MKKENNKDYIWDLNLEPKLELLEEDMKHYVEVCKEKLGFIPNVIKANATDSQRLKTFVNFYNRLMLDEGFLTKMEREMIAVVVSSINKCFYCLIAHGASLRKLSNDPILGEELVMNYRSSRISKKHKIMLDFSAKLTEFPDKVEDSDRNKLRQENFSDEEILEIAEVTGFFNMSNRIALATDMRPNNEYHKMNR
ncbi:MAG: hypothetical protein CFH32_00289 [Alphaproteobacteria bacterium MarineAlpha9_Bin2]|nr:MAG: hypothetical protein CFH32_00289 [Alphaproteobacteria bacterium MarineAlpha9_Bin2]